MHGFDREDAYLRHRDARMNDRTILLTSLLERFRSSLRSDTMDKVSGVPREGSLGSQEDGIMMAFFRKF